MTPSTREKITKEFDEKFPKENGQQNHYQFESEKNTGYNCWESEDARIEIMSFLFSTIESVLAAKADVMGMHRYWHESFKDFADRILGFRAFGVKYNLAASCARFGVDVSDLKAHRAAADVEMADRLYRKIISMA